MARGLNHVYLLGALARDPELKYTSGANPIAVLNLTVAGNDLIVDKDGHEREIPWYHRVTMMGRMGELLADQLKAGDPVLVEGALEYRAWEDATSGQKRSQVNVKALRVDKALAGSRSVPTVTDAQGGQRLTNALNEVMLVGNLTQDAEQRFTQTGDGVTGLNLAINESWKDKTGNWAERVHFCSVSLWRDLAEEAKDLKKGDPVLIMGRLTVESWTEKDGNKRSTTKVEGRRIESLARGETAPRSKPATRRPVEEDDFIPDEDLPF
jgi:single-strand DNA-binding protein